MKKLAGIAAAVVIGATTLLGAGASSAVAGNSWERGFDSGNSWEYGDAGNSWEHGQRGNSWE